MTCRVNQANSEGGRWVGWERGCLPSVCFEPHLGGRVEAVWRDGLAGVLRVWMRWIGRTIVED